MCPPVIGSASTAVVSGQGVLHRIAANGFKVGIAIGHPKGFVANHLFGVFETAASHDDVGTEGVPVVMEVIVFQTEFHWSLLAGGSLTFPPFSIPAISL